MEKGLGDVRRVTVDQFCPMRPMRMIMDTQQPGFENEFTSCKEINSLAMGNNLFPPSVRSHSGVIGHDLVQPIPLHALLEAKALR